MKIVIAMDSFKGSMTSLQAGNAVKEGFFNVDPDLDIEVLPLADGGEGTIDSLLPYIDGTKKYLTVTDPLGRKINSYYVFSRDTAYIEMARASGLTLIERLDPMRATTYGTGELIKDAIQSGYKKLIVCLGGSATNDGGAGVLQALGMKLMDGSGNDIGPGVIGLNDLCSADTSTMVNINSEILIASDVTNPLCGPNGAIFVYGPQKGADENDVKVMDDILLRYAKFFKMDPMEEGTGAAGGLSFALKNFLGGKIVSGAKLFISEIGLEDKIKSADIVITGEGRMDGQTCNGKGPMEVTMLAKKYGKPVYAVAGCLGEGYEKCLEMGIVSIAELKDKDLETDLAVKSVRETSEELLSKII